MSAQVLDQPGNRFGRRNVLASLAGLSVVASLGATRALAQDATDDEVDDTEEAAAMSAERAAAYQNFVGKLAANLGETDTAAVDIGIRDALKAMVDEQFDAGNISRNLADEIKSRIDSSDAPFGLGMMGAVGMRGRKRRTDHRHDTWPGDDIDDDSDDDASEDESTESTPTA